MKKTLVTLALMLTATTAAAGDLTGAHKTCFENAKAKPNAFKAGWVSIIDSNGKQGSYADGDIWVGYDRKLFKKVKGEFVLQKSYKDVVQMCNASGKAY